MEKLQSIFRILIFTFLTSLFAQTGVSQEFQFIYNEAALGAGRWEVTNHTLGLTSEGLPVFRIPVQGRGVGERPEVSLVVKESRRATALALPVREAVYKYTTYSSTVRGQKQWFFELIPVRLVGGAPEILVSFSIEVSYLSDNEDIGALRFPPNTTESALADGDLYKIKIEKTGLHVIDDGFLQTKLGLSLGNIDPRNIKIYGNGGGRLPLANNQFRDDDLIENAIFISGENDGKFDNGDYILWYAEGPDVWRYDNTTNLFAHDKNIYDNANYYFLKISGSPSKRIEISPENHIQPDLLLNSYESLLHYEDDVTNLLGANAGTSGTGKDWYGDYYKGTRTYDYTSKFDFSNIVTDEEAEVRGVFAGRSDRSSAVKFQFGNQQYSAGIASVNLGDSETSYANRVGITQKMTFQTVDPTVSVSYPTNSGESEGWLDYLQIICPKKLVLDNTGFSFRHRLSKNVDVAGFSLENYSGHTIWDITDPRHPQVQVIKNNQLIFETKGACRQFFVFKGLENALVPSEGVSLTNQNLHGIADADVLIVYHPDFEDAAKTLLDHRTAFSGLKVVSASTDQVYNEFSSGRLDPTAIRDFARMLYKRDEGFQYLLLFGDGSYDYKGLMPNLNRENFVPVYETDQSLHPINGFPSDDFFALLDDDEGSDLFGGLDIAIGRLPAKNKTEADVMVSKIIHYDTQSSTLGDWRLRSGYAADDEDSGRHIIDTDEIARRTNSNFPLYNQQKTYFDAFPQVATAGDPRYPEANQSLNSNIFAGQLTLTYLGHGGPQGWAQERVLTLKDIKNWTNMDKLFLMITATCSFAAYDDTKIVSPGEEAILNAKGGAIALFSTTRAVYTNSNKELTDAVHRIMFQKINGKAQTFGQILKEGKNKNSSQFTVENSRKFTLLGDPSQPIALPKENIVLTKVNKKNVGEETDTLKAMSFIEMEGYVADANNQILGDFNGTLQTTIYDKINQLRTLENDERSPLFEFEQYQNIIFKGKTSVKDGKFSFKFWVPKDIDYEIGYGRISLYASDGISRDAAGYSNDIKIGGSSGNGIVDDVPPRVDVFMNDESFVSGGITNNDPILLVKLQDDFGINVTGNAIGHDITSVLNNITSEASVLNDFFESDTDSYTSGMVRYPLKDLPAGKHTIKVKAWDIANNSAEKSTEFLVVNGQQEFLDRVLNYPNPFTTNTRFEFDHDLNNTNLNIHVYIYSVSGKLVKTVEHTSFYPGNRVNDVRWNGRDDYEDKLARGVYLYKIKIHAPELNQTRESKFEKLVIL